jgi:hypothetical protein
VPIIIVSASYIYRAKQQIGHTQKIWVINGHLVSIIGPNTIMSQISMSAHELATRAIIYQDNLNLGSINLGPFMVHFIKYPATAGYFLRQSFIHECNEYNE